MLYDVVLLCRDGHRRLRADILREVPMRGDVIMAEGKPMEGMVATLSAAGTVLARLEHCRITRMASSSLVLAGTETTVDDLTHRQEWWCRQVSGGPPRPYDPDPPSAVERDLSYATGWVMAGSAGKSPGDLPPSLAALMPCQYPHEKSRNPASAGMTSTSGQPAPKLTSSLSARGSTIGGCLPRILAG